jgi:hypothetical protein
MRQGICDRYSCAVGPPAVGPVRRTGLRALFLTERRLAVGALLAVHLPARILRSIDPSHRIDVADCLRNKYPWYACLMVPGVCYACDAFNGIGGSVGRAVFPLG